MSIRTHTKLNHLLECVPDGVAIPSSWLSANGYPPQLVRKYVQGGWLRPLGSRVYARPAEAVTWEGVILGLQRLGGYQLHVGGVTSLNRHGLAHYLSLSGDAVVQVWGQGRAPAWVGQVDVGVRWSFHTRRLFSHEPQSSWAALPTQFRDWTLRCSTPERAILEVLSEVGESSSAFSFEGLTTLRPATVNELLQSCIHNKAKRLFLFLADYYNYPWVKRVDTEAIDLGSGKRMITRGGKLDKRYLITVPEEFHAG